MYNSNSGYQSQSPPGAAQHPGGGYPQGYPQTYPASGYPQQTYTGSYPSGQPYSYSQSSIPQGRIPSNTYGTPDEDPSAMFDFSEKSIRRNFIRKVYSILTVQLLITLGFVGLFIFEKKVNKYFQVHYEFLIIAVVLVFVLTIVLVCFSNVRRTTPLNFICLAFYTIAFSFLVGVCAAQYSSQEVMLAVGMTAAITLGLTLFAFQTKYDFTSWGGALFALILILLIGGIFGIIFPSRILQTVLAGFGALLMSLYIIYDTQLMMGGSHKYSISPEEYIFATLNLYLDIINLFLFILELIGRRD